MLNNISQSRLAELADINEKYYSRIERDENNPTYHMLKKIMNALDMEMRQLSVAIENNNSYEFLFFPLELKYGFFVRNVSSRFVAEVECNDKKIDVYVASSTKISNLLHLENKKVTLIKVQSSNKYDYCLFTVDYNNINIIINLNVVNKIFYELYCAGVLAGYKWYGEGKKEVFCGEYKADYVFEEEKIIVENKTIISEEAVCFYPIQNSDRCKNQFVEIKKLLNNNFGFRLNFFILTPWTNRIIMEERFFKKLVDLIDKGLRLYFYYLYYDHQLLRVIRMDYSIKKDSCEIVLDNNIYK